MTQKLSKAGVNVHWIVAIFVLAAATYFDLRWRRIPNRLLIGGALLGLLIYAVDGGLRQLPSALAGGAAIAFSFGLCAWRGWVGLGDAKAMGVLGFLLGWQKGLYAITYGFIVGAAVTIAYMLWKGRAREIFPVGGGGASTGSRPLVPLAPFLLVGTLVLGLRS